MMFLTKNSNLLMTKGFQAIWGIAVMFCKNQRLTPWQKYNEG